MKKILAPILIIALIAASFAGCGSSSVPVSGGEKLSIVTTTFPIYDWTLNVLGDNPAGAGLTMMLDSGVDMHSFQPSASDIVKLSGCDLFIYVGGESDSWVNDVLKEAVNKNMHVLNLLDVLGDAAKTEDDEPEYDEHIWLSLNNAELLTKAIADELSELDIANAQLYSGNAEAYIKQLSALDSDYRALVDVSEYDTLVFGDRFPFRYMTEDYGLSCYAAFGGCSAESEASFETITFLAGKIDELNLPCIFKIEDGNTRIAETIIANTKAKNQKIIELNSMQNISRRDAQGGVSYLSIMNYNLNALKEGLL